MPNRENPRTGLNNEILSQTGKTEFWTQLNNLPVRKTFANYINDNFFKNNESSSTTIVTNTWASFLKTFLPELTLERIAGE